MSNSIRLIQANRAPMVHSVPSCKKRSYKKRLVDMGEGKKRQLVGLVTLRNAFLS